MPVLVQLLDEAQPGDFINIIALGGGVIVKKKIMMGEELWSTRGTWERVWSTWERGFGGKTSCGTTESESIKTIPGLPIDWEQLTGLRMSDGDVRRG